MVREYFLTFEAVKIYIRLISVIAGEYEKKLVNKLSLRFLKLGNQGYINRLAYIYWKRKTHVGLDLHHSAIRILEEITKSHFISSPDDRDQFIKLRRLFKKKTFESTLKKYCKTGIPVEDEFALNISALKKFHDYAISYIEDCRKKIREKIENEKILWKLQPNEYLYIVTYGYSKVVRDIIKYSIPKILKSNWDMFKRNYQDTLFNQENKVQNNRFKIIVFQSEGESKIDSRMIKYHLTEEKGRGFADVLVSNPDFIIPLIDKDTKILILMGDEAFDQQGRIIRTSCYKGIMKHFIYEAKKRIKTDDNIRVIVCVESFKSNNDIRLIDSYFDDQYDKIEMYEPELISSIVSV